MKAMHRVLKRAAGAGAVLAAIAIAQLTMTGGVSAQDGSVGAGNPTILAAVQQLQQQVAALQASLVATQGQLDALRPRAYYLSTVEADGAGAPSACAAGFHMASLWEIHDTTVLRYATALGTVTADSGSGPPNDEFGWIRTGNRARAGGPGEANCEAYVTNGAGFEGSQVQLTEEWESPASGRVSPWDVSTLRCDLPSRVWCVQD